MSMTLEEIMAILRATPECLNALVRNLPERLVHAHEGLETWSPHQIVGHLIYGEETDWMVRLDIILAHGESQPFAPFDRVGFEGKYTAQSMPELLDIFTEMRRKNLEKLLSLNLSDSDLRKTGRHPAFGSVTVEQLLTSWAVHDLGHIRQIVRVIANQYADEVGPWREYLTIIEPRKA